MDIFVVIVMVYKPKLTNTFSSTKMIVKLLLQISSVLLTIFHFLHFLFCFCSLVKYAFLKEDWLYPLYFWAILLLGKMEFNPLPGILLHVLFLLIHPWMFGKIFMQRDVVTSQNISVAKNYWIGNWSITSVLFVFLL